MSNNKQQLSVLFLAVFLNLTGFAIILPLSPALMDHYLTPNATGLIHNFVNTAHSLAQQASSLNPTHATATFFACLLASLYAFLQFVCAPIWGKISDKTGRKPILILTMLGTTASYLMWALAPNFETFIASRIIAGLMAGNLAVATAAIADITSRDSRTKGMAIIGAAFGLGFLFGPAIGGLATKIPLSHPTLNPFSAPALISAALCLINALWIAAKFKESLPKSLRTNEKQKHDTSAALLTAISKTNLSYFIFILAFSGLEFTLAFLAAQRFDFGPVQIGYLFLYIGFILVLIQGYAIRKLVNKFTEKTIGLIGITSGIVAFGTLAYATSYPTFYAGSAFLAISIGLVSPTLSGLVSLYATPQTQGLFLGKFRSRGALARASGPLAIAFVYFYYGPEVAYLTAIVTLLIPAMLILKLPKPSTEASE